MSHTTWMIVKCDMLAAGTDVPHGMSHFEMGWKAVVSTVSDFAAKGVTPRGLVVAVGLPSATSKKQLRMIGRGLRAASREYNCPIAGGDTSESDMLVIDVAGFGWTRPRDIIRRDSARPGDIVAVTGKFGNPAAGLRLLLSGKSRIGSSQKLIRAVTRPKARLREGLRLSKTGLVTSSMDSSDGLGWSLNEIARLSKVGIRIDHVPVSKEAREYAEKNRISPEKLALYGGEEYELVLTIKQDGIARARKAVPSLIKIGTVARGTGVTAIHNGRTVNVERRGWEHFR